MKTISKYNDRRGRLLVIKETPTGNLVGEVFNDGNEKRRKADMRATFYVSDREATEFRVCEYFGFDIKNKTV